MPSVVSVAPMYFQCLGVPNFFACTFVSRKPFCTEAFSFVACCVIPHVLHEDIKVG